MEVVGRRVPIMGRCGVCQGVSNHSSLVLCGFTIFNVILPVLRNGELGAECDGCFGRRKKRDWDDGHVYTMTAIMDD